jgi:hypothetical protein
MTNQPTNRPNAALVARATRIACRRFPLIEDEDQAVTMPFFRLVELLTLALEEGGRLAAQHGEARPKNEGLGFDRGGQGHE